MNRWRYRVVLLQTGCLLALSVSAYPAGTWNVTQLTNNDYDDLTPDMSGGNLAWCANIAGSSTDGREIMFYDGSAVIRLTTNSCADMTPRVDANGVCWQRKFSSTNWEVFYHTSSGTDPLTGNGYLNLSPKLLDGRVVWHGNSTGNYEIYLYDGLNVKQLTNNDYPDMHPVLSHDRIAWSGEFDDDWEIFTYDNDGIKRLTINDVDDTAPCFGNNIMFWRMEDDSGLTSNGRIAMYDGTTITMLTDAVLNDLAPKACGNRAAWYSLDLEKKSHDIFLYTGTEVLRLTDDYLDDDSPVISDDLVVWSADDGQDREIFVYDGVNTVQLTDNDYDDQYPCISGRTIAWVGFGDPNGGQDGEIFLATHTPEPGAAFALLFGAGWLTRRRRARTIRRSYDYTYCRHG